MLPRAKEIFSRALERPPARRRAFVAAACSHDQALRHEVESLLAAFERAGGFLSEPAGEDGEAGLHIGRYRLVERLGEGGFGTVWRAQQVEPLEREVALKIIRREPDDPRAIEAFASEQQLLARMDHPASPASSTRERRIRDVPTSSWSSCAANPSRPGAAKARCRCGTGCACSAACAWPSNTRTRRA